METLTTDNTSGYLQVMDTERLSASCHKKVTVEEFDEKGNLIKRTITETNDDTWTPIQPVPIQPYRPYTPGPIWTCENS